MKFLVLRHITSGKEKGTFNFSSFRGLPHDLIDCRIPSFWTVFYVHFLSPRGRSRLKLRRILIAAGIHIGISRIVIG